MNDETKNEKTVRELKEKFGEMADECLESALIKSVLAGVTSS